MRKALIRRPFRAHHGKENRIAGIPVDNLSVPIVLEPFAFL
ncbi:hypothetical protein C8N35_103242 [Breoghania corrubedonensis]|uniref:Uncharacterized protein n=1 Tax=Breoghania corrubedonensis TaxID=665038 RepID=A0A2T5VBE0_9HYPH|nr:hypothetical protein C8N35_103242 [Breoghania corrubedonensis]